jgi:hypothetical protein
VIERGDAMKREEKDLWFAGDGREPKFVKGYSCAPMNPGVWWCPEVGFSAFEGTDLFYSYTEAVQQMRLRLIEKRAEIDKKLAHLETL